MAGQIMDLGGFRSLVHKHDLERQIKITLHYEGKLRTEKYLPTTMYYTYGPLCDYNSGQGEPDEVDINQEFHTSIGFSVSVATAWSNAENVAYVSSYKVNLESHDLLQVVYRPGDVARIILHLEHSLFFDYRHIDYDDDKMIFLYAVLGTVFRFGTSIAYSEFREERTVQQEERARQLFMSMTDEERQAFLDLLYNEDESDGEECEPVEENQDSTERKSWEELVQKLRSRVGTYTVELNPARRSAIPLWGTVISFALPYKDELLRREEYEGYDPRDFLGREINWVMSQLILAPGESILHELRNLRYLGPIREIPKRDYNPPRYLDTRRWASGLGAWDMLASSPLTSELETEPNLFQRCNTYLKDVLKLGYSVRKVEKGSHQVEALPLNARLQLHDEKNDVDVAPSDIGVGVSQVLPVVVGAADPNCSIFAVEQPELHIHPAVQVALGDVFIRETMGEGGKPRIFLLETHSEHLILRIMRRIRETWSKKLPEGFPSVTPEDVAVLLVEVVDGKTIIREMPLNERGELVKAWPGGFFEEALRETL
ncbi:MAG: AAA family ATPase [Candidatus Hydrogenedentes bacterium]|nr:AAA family ATPase [Candidatus Hydrogenedentota bacterium]